MTTVACPPDPSIHGAIRAGEVVARDVFELLRRRMMLEFCKWDPQVGDVSTLAGFPLILPRSQWDALATMTVSLAKETIELERQLLNRPDLHHMLGLPGRLCRVLRDAAKHSVTPGACRIMRFDFHPTPDGWRISEVNSDVPGGFAEASQFTELMAEHSDNLITAGDPQKTYAQALARVVGEGGAIALLAAPGFMEDQQIIAGLARQLSMLGIQALLAEPHHLRWNDGWAMCEAAYYRGRVDAIVRFYQGEWLARLPSRVGWQHLFVGGRTPLANPGRAILSESKRLPLVWDALGVACDTWKRLLPETRDPRDAPWRRDAGWILKTAYCNTGDSVTIRELLPRRAWRKRWLDVSLSPRQWVAQRRFETVPIKTPMGEMFPCIGVYAIDGRACGIYGRLSQSPVIDYAAIDVAVLIEPDGMECRNEPRIYFNGLGAAGRTMVAMG